MSLWHQGETKFRSRHLRDSAVPEPAVEVQSVPEHSQCSRTCSNDPGVVYYVEAPPRSCLNEKTDCQVHTEPLSSHSWPASKDLNCQHSLQSAHSQGDKSAWVETGLQQRRGRLGSQQPCWKVAGSNPIWPLAEVPMSKAPNLSLLQGLQPNNLYLQWLNLSSLG